MNVYEYLHNQKLNKKMRGCTSFRQTNPSEALKQWVNQVQDTSKWNPTLKHFVHKRPCDLNTGHFDTASRLLYTDGTTVQRVRAFLQAKDLHTFVSPCWDGCRHGLWFRWPSLSAHAQCRWRTSSCRLAPPCQSAALCSVHVQPESKSITGSVTLWLKPAISNRTIQLSKLQYLHFVVFADGHGPHVVLLAELLGQRGRHDLPPDVWGGIEVPLAVLTTRGCYKWVKLHDAVDRKNRLQP